MGASAVTDPESPEAQRIEAALLFALFNSPYRLRQLKTWDAREGQGWQAYLTEHGKDIAQVYEAGNGGQIEIRWHKAPGGWARFGMTEDEEIIADRFEAWCDTLPPSPPVLDGFPGEEKIDTESAATWLSMLYEVNKKSAREVKKGKAVALHPTQGLLIFKEHSAKKIEVLKPMAKDAIWMNDVDPRWLKHG